MMFESGTLEENGRMKHLVVRKILEFFSSFYTIIQGTVYYPLQARKWFKLDYGLHQKWMGGMKLTQQIEREIIPEPILKKLSQQLLAQFWIA